jgi:hypothetical protein
VGNSGRKVRKVQSSDAQSQDAVLSSASAAAIQRDVGVGLFAVDRDMDDRRASQTIASIPERLSDATIREELIRLLGMPICLTADAPMPPSITGNEALARVMIRRAIRDEAQNAIDAVLDRIEGKPTKSASNKPSNGHIDTQLDLQVDALNSLAGDLNE